jgi:hypothetical protein
MGQVNDRSPSRLLDERSGGTLTRILASTSATGGCAALECAERRSDRPTAPYMDVVGPRSYGLCRRNPPAPHPQQEAIIPVTCV